MPPDNLVGQLPDVWTLTTLGEVCGATGGNIQTGPFGSQLHASDYVEVGIPSIMPQNIGDNRISLDGIARISMADAERLNRYLVRPGDIIYSRRGDVERRALIRSQEDGWLCGTGCLRVRFGDESKINPVFVSYYLGHPNVREWIVRHAVGATMPNLNTSILSALPFVMPPIKEQQQIASVLGVLDEKIELNRRMNETLEAMARAIFQSWFVDFDPVHAKAEGRQPWGMDSNTVTLFPERLVAGIPAGWVVEKIGAVTAINKSSIGRDWPHDEIEYVDIASVSEGHLSDTSKLTLSEAPSRAKRCVTHGDTIWSCVRPNRRSFLFINHPPSNTVVSTGFAVLSPIKVTPNYLYLWTTTQEFTDYLTANADGSAYPAVRPEHFASAEILVPPKSLLDSFEQIVAPYRDKIHHNLYENRTLADLRDTLLPKLIAGEILIKEAEQKIEEEIA